MRESSSYGRTLSRGFLLRSFFEQGEEEGGGSRKKRRKGEKGEGAHTSALYLSICEAIFSAGNVGLSSVFYKVVT